MKVLSWNIRQGGGRRIDCVIDALLKHGADVMGLAECKSNNNLSKLRQVLGDAGWVHQSIVEPEIGQYAVMVLSKLPFKSHKAESDESFVQSRWQDIIVGSSDTRIIFAHVPDYVKPITGVSRKEIFWQLLVEQAKRYQQGKVLILGDLNTGLLVDGPGFRCVNYFQTLLDLGFKDVWRESHPGTTEFTWYSRSNGFRLDHAFASPPLVSYIGEAYYSHTEREKGISDHSILLIEMV